MATKTIDSDLIINGEMRFYNITKYITIKTSNSYGLSAYFYLQPTAGELFITRIKNYNPLETGYTRLMFGNGNISSFCEDDECHLALGRDVFPWVAVYSKKFIVPNGTAAQFLKADGSLDGTAYATQTALNSLQNNAWKLSEANAEVESVVVQLTNKGIFETMTEAKINPLTSRNIYVDLSKAENLILDIFAGYKDLPVGVRYHIFFGNTPHDVKLNWTQSEIESNIAGGVIGLTAAYPTAKCEFMRVTETWTFADWEAKINNVNHVVDTGTASESDNSTLMNFMDNNKIAYSKTAKGALVNISALLAALAGQK